MAGLRPYEDFGWVESQGPAVGMADIITQDRMNQEAAPSRQVPYQAPVAGVEGGALSQSFGNYRMTPGSPSVTESNHWNYYQPEMEADSDYAPPPVDPTQDPAGALAATTQIRAFTGGGTGTPRPMPVPKPGMVANEAADQQGNQVMFDQNKIPKWNESKAFGAGLLSFGLNLLSGNDLATAFNQAGNHFQQSYGREKRELWAQDLAEQGYDAHEIQAYIETGDSKALTDPMQKKMQMQQYKLGQAQLQKAQWETSPEMLEWQAQREYTKDLQSARGLELQEMSTMANIQNQQANQAIARETLNMRKAAAAAKAGEDNEKFSAEKHKNTMYYLRGNQGLKNYNRMLESNGGQVYNPQSLAGDMADAATIEGMFSGNQMMETAARRANPRLAEMVGAERAFLAPILRVESGAAISNMEWKTTGEQFFPRPGDSQQRIEQKSQLRELAVVAQNPNASKELQQAMEMYATGALPGFRLVNGQAYVSQDGKNWAKVQMHK